MVFHKNTTCNAYLIVTDYDFVILNAELTYPSLEENDISHTKVIKQYVITKESRKEELEYLGFMLYDKPIRFMYYLKKDINIEDIVVQEEEVEFVKWLSIDEIKELAFKGANLSVKNGKYNFLNIVLDRINGIDLDTIVEATNIINPLLDEADLINEEYHLDIYGKSKGSN